MNVLLTGGSGAVGRPVCAFLAARGHTVRRFDRTPNGDRPPLAGVQDVCADITDHPAVLRACTGIEAIVHLAATPDDAPFPELVPPNVLGVFNVLDAARQQAVPRVVLASSVQVAWHRDSDGPRTAAHVAPTNHYALTKVWAEQMGEMYARTTAMSIVAARIGWMVRNPREALRMRELGMERHYVSPRDVGHFIGCAIEAPLSGLTVLYAIGPAGRHAYDLETPGRLIGYAPQDHFPEGLPFEVPPPPEAG